MTHLGADIEGPKLLQEVEAALFLLSDSLSVAFAVQLVPGAPKIHNNAFFSVRVLDEVIVSTLCHKVTKWSSSSLYSASWPSLIHPATVESSEYFWR